MNFSDLASARQALKRNGPTRVTNAAGKVFLETADGTLVETGERNVRIEAAPDEKMAEILPGFLFLGSQDAAMHLQGLREAKITHIVNCAFGEDCFPEEFRYMRLELLDTDEQPLQGKLDDAFAFLDRVKQSGGRVLVHCNAGISRSPTLIIAYLMIRQQISFDEALRMVNEKRRVKPNPGFEKQLKEMDNKKG